MESQIKIKATVPEMRDFFEKDGGVRFYEIRDKRYTQRDLDAMPEEKHLNERFAFKVVYRHMELEKPLTGTFTIGGLLRKMNEFREVEKRHKKKPSEVEKLKESQMPNITTANKEHPEKEER